MLVAGCGLHPHHACSCSTPKAVCRTVCTSSQQPVRGCCCCMYAALANELNHMHLALQGLPPNIHPVWCATPLKIEPVAARRVAHTVCAVCWRHHAVGNMQALQDSHHRLLSCLQEGNGKISLRMLQSYASKHGGETLTLEDLKGLFQDFKPSNENYINQQEFLRFFARVSGTITNKEFEAMIEEMQG